MCIPLGVHPPPAREAGRRPGHAALHRQRAWGGLPLPQARHPPTMTAAPATVARRVEGLVEAGRVCFRVGGGVSRPWGAAVTPRGDVSPEGHPRTAPCHPGGRRGNRRPGGESPATAGVGGPVPAGAEPVSSPRRETGRDGDIERGRATPPGRVLCPSRRPSRCGGRLPAQQADAARLRVEEQPLDAGGEQLTAGGLEPHVAAAAHKAALQQPTRSAQCQL
mgnify:CR=1 FL=1